MTVYCFGALFQVRATGHCVIGQERYLLCLIGHIGGCGRGFQRSTYKFSSHPKTLELTGKCGIIYGMYCIPHTSLEHAHSSLFIIKTKLLPGLYKMILFFAIFFNQTANQQFISRTYSFKIWNPLGGLSQNCAISPTHMLFRYIITYVQSWFQIY